MKERFKFESLKIYNEQAGLEEQQYFKVKQIMTWQFYIRPIKLWFEPCPKCQKRIEESYIDMLIRGILENFRAWLQYADLCRECKKYIACKAAEAPEVIIGNKDYEPMVELSRKWLDDDDSRIRISKEDYDKRNDNAKPFGK